MDNTTELRQETEFGPAVVALLREHLDSMASLSPAESVHALDIDSLKRAEITFWCLWTADQLMGCCALKELNSQHAEIKSMRTASAFLRQGVAATLLEHIITTAKDRAYRRLSLETGSAAAFSPAHKLYSQFGFAECPPFGEYQVDPHSVFMTLKLKLQ